MPALLWNRFSHPLHGPQGVPVIIFWENRNLTGLGLRVLDLDGVHDELHAALGCRRRDDRAGQGRYGA